MYFKGISMLRFICLRAHSWRVHVLGATNCISTGLSSVRVTELAEKPQNQSINKDMIPH